MNKTLARNRRRVPDAARVTPPELYFFVWREKIVPRPGFVIVDFQRPRSSGRIIGYEDFECRTLTSFPVGARMRVIT